LTLQRSAGAASVQKLPPIIGSAPPINDSDIYTGLPPRQRETFLATSSRADWATLLSRTFGFEARRCPACAAKMRVLATSTEPIEAPPIARAQRPAFDST
jgi:hypothetical protein